MNVKKRLTDRFIKSVKSPLPNQTYADEYADELQPKLRLAVFPSGKMTWIVRHKLGGKKFTIGDHPAFSLAQARDAAAEALRLVAKGIDPTEARKAKLMAERRDSVQACFEQYMDACNAKPLRPKAIYEKRRIITNEILPRWGKRPVQSITRRDVRELLSTVVKRSKSAANCIRVHGGAMFNWLVEGDVIEKSPFAGVAKPVRETPRTRVLTKDELCLIWRAATALGGPFAAILQLLVLTGQRREEVVQLQWRELDSAKELWTLPAERAKNHRQHDVPLSREAQAIIAALPHNGDYLFTLKRRSKPVTGFSVFKAKLDKTITELNDGVPLTGWTIHDIRRSVVTHMAEMGIAPHVIEAIVNHISGHKGGIAGIYNKATYADPKRQALAVWAASIVGLVSGKRLESDNVMPVTAAMAGPP